MPTSTAIDWQRCLKAANGNADLADELLGLLVADLPKMQSDIKAAYQSKDYDALLGRVHKLHGASCYSGVPNLTKQSTTLEAILKKESYQTIDPPYEALIQEIDHVLADFATKNYSS